jgi:phage shock protein PspC (stress-responsive transcriptional regulator)
MPENRRLVRVHEGRVLAGVCTGLGRYTRVDPVVFRVGFAVLTLAASGSGILLYLAAALLMPADEGAFSVVERTIKRRLDGDAMLAALGALLTACVLFSVIGGGLGGKATGPLTVVTVFALALLAAHARGVNLVKVARTLPERFQGTPIRPDERPAAPPPDPAAMVDLATLNAPARGAVERSIPARGTADHTITRPLTTRPLTTRPLTTRPLTTRPLTTRPLPPEPQPSPERPAEPPGPPPSPAEPFVDTSPTEPLPPLPESAGEAVGAGGPAGGGRAGAGRRHVSGLTWPTFLTVLGAGAVTVPLTSHHPVTTRVSIAIAAGLAVLGAALIISSWYGRGRGLVSLGVVLCLALVATSAVGELPSDGRWGDVHWRPATARAEQSYRVIIGEGDLDLTALPLGEGQRVRVRAAVSFGELKVTVPTKVTTEVHASSSLGDVNVAGRVTSGPRAKVDVVLPAEVAGGKADGHAPVIELFLRGRIGDVEVRRVPT